MEQRSPQIYGLSFHSPLIIRGLIPARRYKAVYLPPKWTGGGEALEETSLASDERCTIVLASSLPSLQQFLKINKDTNKSFKVLLFDFPGHLNPFLHPLIQWLDCDHQAGGAWQITRIKMEALDQKLEVLAPLDEEGKTFILQMTMFDPQERGYDLDKLTKALPEDLKKSYAELLDAGNDSSKNSKDLDKDSAAKDTKWKKKTLHQLLRELLDKMNGKNRSALIDLVIDYAVHRTNKREFNVRMKALFPPTDALEKYVVMIRKWVDDSKRGGALFRAYLDYLGNIEKRSWKAIVDGFENALVAEQDLLMIIAHQPRDEEMLGKYTGDLKTIESYPPSSDLLEPSFQWANGELYFHPEPIPLHVLFEYEGPRDDEEDGR